MPPKEPPAHTQVNGTIKIANHERVVAPVENPSGVRSNQAPGGGEARFGVPDGEAPTRPENWKDLPHARQRARSVETFTSSSGMLRPQAGQFRSMEQHYRRCADAMCLIFAGPKATYFMSSVFAEYSLYWWPSNRKETVVTVTAVAPIASRFR